MKARGSANPKVEEDHDPEEEDSHGEVEDHVEKGLVIVATLQEDQEEEVYDSQSEMSFLRAKWEWHFAQKGSNSPQMTPQPYRVPLARDVDDCQGLMISR